MILLIASLSLNLSGSNGESDISKSHQFLLELATMVILLVSFYLEGKLLFKLFSQYFRTIESRSSKFLGLVTQCGNQAVRITHTDVLFQNVFEALYSTPPVSIRQIGTPMYRQTIISGTF